MSCLAHTLARRARERPTAAWEWDEYRSKDHNFILHHLSFIYFPCFSYYFTWLSLLNYWLLNICVLPFSPTLLPRPHRRKISGCIVLWSWLISIKTPIYYPALKNANCKQFYFAMLLRAGKKFNLNASWSKALHKSNDSCAMPIALLWSFSNCSSEMC